MSSTNLSQKHIVEFRISWMELLDLVKNTDKKSFIRLS